MVFSDEDKILIKTQMHAEYSYTHRFFEIGVLKSNLFAFS